MTPLTVIKFGGSLVKDLQIHSKLISEISKISHKQKVILVHGGGYEINMLLKKFSITSKFVDGLRFTDLATLSIVEMALSGKVNRALTTEFIKNGANAVGISGKDGKSVICKQIKHLGYVGKPIKMNKKLIGMLIRMRFMPVIASIASDVNGNVLNVNADVLASYIAIIFKAYRLIFLTNVPGILDKNGNIIKEINIENIDDMINCGTITGGMLPKIKSSMESVKNGVSEVWITCGTTGIMEIRGSLIK
ncbi:MAG: acetylglutamate kinase [Endomicrobium sp.]|jgi:acetylglutamate kinase|nr:acetylglutamate kinase [Endomicrobium sp.]